MIGGSILRIIRDWGVSHTVVSVNQHVYFHLRYDKQLGLDKRELVGSRHYTLARMLAYVMYCIDVRIMIGDILYVMSGRVISGWCHVRGFIEGG